MTEMKHTAQRKTRKIFGLDGDNTLQNGVHASRKVVEGMDKTDKALKGLDCCIRDSGCYDCPYLSKPGCSARLKQDAINLLKSQQAEIERLKEMQQVDNCERCRFKDKCLTGRQLDR